MVFAENRGSRVFHLMMILPAGLLLLVLSLISLSTLAVTNQRFLDEYEDKDPDGDATCILYADKGNDFEIKFKSGETCRFAVVGGAILGGLAVGFMVILVLKALFGTNVVSAGAMIELFMSVAGAVWAFIVSVVITAGLDQTCKAYRETFKSVNLDKFPCCSYYYKFGDNLGDSSNVYFYEGINASRITAWFTMALLMFLAGLYLCIVIRYCCGGRGSKSSGAQPLENEEKKESVPM